MQQIMLMADGRRIPVHCGDEDVGAAVTNAGPGVVSYSGSEAGAAAGTIAPLATATLYGSQYLWATAGASVRIAAATVDSTEGLSARLLSMESSSVVTKTGAYTVTDSDDVILADATGLQPPANLAVSAIGGGGTFAAATYYWRITALNALGESLGCAEVSKAIAASGSGGLTWDAVTGATSYRVYRRNFSGAHTGNVSYIAEVGTNAYTDTGTVESAPNSREDGKLHTQNTSGPFTITLHNAATAKAKSYTIEAIHKTSGTVRVAAPAGQTIDGEPEVALRAHAGYRAITVRPVGSMWRIVHSVRNSEYRQRRIGTTRNYVDGGAGFGALSDGVTLGGTSALKTELPRMVGRIWPCYQNMLDDAVNPDPITIKAGFGRAHPAGTPLRVTFDGADSKVLPGNSKAMVIADAMKIAVAPPFPFECSALTHVTVTAGAKFPRNILARHEGSEGHNYPAGGTLGADVTTTYQARLANADSYVYGPCGFIVETLDPTQPYAFVIAGDSTVWGVTSGKGGAQGFGLADAIGSDAPWINLGRPAATVVALATGLERDKAAVGCTDTLLHGIANDLSGGSTEAVCRSALQNWWAYWAGQVDRVWACTPMPCWTTSTDLFQTVANQTAHSTRNPIRVALANWMRAATPECVHRVIETAWAVESSHDSGKWDVNIVPNCVTSTATTTVTCGAAHGLVIGQLIFGTGIPAGAWVGSVPTPTTFTLTTGAPGATGIGTPVVAASNQAATTVTGVLTGDGTHLQAAANARASAAVRAALAARISTWGS